MALIKTIDDIRENVNAGKSINIKNIEPYVAQAEEDFIIPVISQEQFDDLQTKFDALPTPVPAPYDRLLKIVQRSLSNYALLLQLPDGVAQHTNAGIMESRPDHAGPSPQWKQRDKEKNYLKQGDKEIEKALKFLEENKATFTLWANSDEFTQSKDTFINTTDDFNKYVVISTRTTFKKLIPFMRSVEDLVIRKLICQDQYDALKSQHEADTLTGVNVLLLDKIKYVIAHKTVLKAVDMLNSEITDQGIRLRNTTDTIDRTGSPTIGQLKDFRSAMLRDYKERENDLKLFLEDNIDDYPLYEASDCFTAKADPGPTHEIDNDVNNKGFIV